MKKKECKLNSKGKTILCKMNYLSGSDIEYEFKLSEIVSAERLVLWDLRIDRVLECRPATL